MSSQPLTVLGGLSAEQFMSEYWQKKPLLVRQAMPALIGMFEPEDLFDLALEDGVTARLLTQHGKQHDQWKVKNSPFTKKELNTKNLPPLWTLLVQAVDHWSIELAELWQQFDFIPQWRRDDIMISYAPEGGSVGRHFDQYDVFLVQASGKRHWQLGQTCDDGSTQLVPNQPLRLLNDLGEVVFDEVLEAGDLLYVPPRLAHYGVAQGQDCLTCSFGFRMPNPAQLLERLTDELLGNHSLNTPVSDLLRTATVSSGAVLTDDLNALRQALMSVLYDPESFQHAVMVLLSEPKYPESLPESEAFDTEAWQHLMQVGARIRLDPAARLLYVEAPDQQLRFYCNGEALDIDEQHQVLLQSLADGAWLEVQQWSLLDQETLNDWLADGMLLVSEPDD
ncbi:MAG: cupin domain-containing protein [Pseudomonadota bacterium]|nr:cupin domain-containing protein [Pseudomonadota bacterium]